MKSLRRHLRFSPSPRQLALSYTGHWLRSWYCEWNAHWVSVGELVTQPTIFWELHPLFRYFIKFNRNDPAFFKALVSRDGSNYNQLSKFDFWLISRFDAPRFRQVIWSSEYLQSWNNTHSQTQHTKDQIQSLLLHKKHRHRSSTVRQLENLAEKGVSFENPSGSLCLQSFGTDFISTLLRV